MIQEEKQTQESNSCHMSFLFTPSSSEHRYVTGQGNLLSDYNDATTITAYLFWVLNTLNCKRGLWKVFEAIAEHLGLIPSIHTVVHNHL